MSVTVFPNAMDTTTAEVGTVAGVIRVIRSDAYAGPVAWIRSCKANKDPTAEDAKRQLPVIVWAGQFSRRANEACRTYSGLVVLDLDDLEDSAAVRDRLKGDPHITCCFRSPGGDGCKPVVLTDATSASEHRAAWRTACAYLLATHGLTVSPGQGDVSRACFASHDPDAWINEQAVPLAVDRSLVEPAQESTASPHGERIAKDRHQYLVAYCARLSRAGLGESEIEAAARALIRDRFDLSDGRTFPDSEIHRAASSAGKYRTGDDAAAVVHGAQAAAGLIQHAETPSPTSRIVLRTHADRMRECLNPPPELIEGLLPVGGIGAVIALPGNGKTMMALEIARCIAGGEAVAGKTVQQGRAVYLCTDSPADTERRMLALGDAGESILSVADAPLFPGGIPELEAALDQVPGVKLVVLDTWDSTREHETGGYAGVDAAVELAMRELRRMARQRGLAVLVVHHATRGDSLRARGSVVFDARCDWIATVEQTGDILTLASVKVRSGQSGEVGRWQIQTVELPGSERPAPRLVAVGLLQAAAAQGEALGAKRQAMMARAVAVLATLPEGQGMTARALADVLGLKLGRAIQEISDDLVAAGLAMVKPLRLTPAGRAFQAPAEPAQESLFGGPE